MTFEQTLNNRPTAYNFSREKWNKVSDVDALVASLKEAHEREIEELRKVNAHVVEKMKTALAMQADREIHEHIKAEREWIDQQIGRRLTLKGTVKAHKEREGLKETQLNRCKFKLA